MSYLAELSRMAAGGLVAAVWQGLLLAAAIGLGLKLIPKAPAAVRFAIWFAVFVVVAGLPLVALWPREDGSVQAGGHSAWLTLDARWSLAIAAVWAVASLVRAGTLGMAAMRVRTLWKRAKPVPAAGDIDPTHRANAAMDRASEISDQGSTILLGTRRAQICTSDEVDRPTVIGFFAPKILIPTWLLEKLTAAELEQIVLHETGHLGRADDWMNLLQKVALVVFPLNPALAWVERRLCFERELACDERVLRTTQAPKAYAACLASLAEHRMGRRGLALGLGALGRESELGRRVGRILRRGETMRPVHARLVLGGAMLGLLGGAVGLERFPQVIGFAAASDQNARVAASGSVGSVAPSLYRDAYKAVVFHPEASGGEIARRRGPGSNRANSGTRGCANTTPCSTKLRGHGALNVKQGEPAFMGTERRIAFRDGTVDGPRRLVSTRAVRWVVVTDWQEEDGSRLVLTSAPTYSGRAGVSSDSGPEWSAEPERVGPDLQQFEEFYPYAAVPVRGGWLVFQL